MNSRTATRTQLVIRHAALFFRVQSSGRGAGRRRFAAFGPRGHVAEGFERGGIRCLVALRGLDGFRDRGGRAERCFRSENTRTFACRMGSASKCACAREHQSQHRGSNGVQPRSQNRALCGGKIMRITRINASGRAFHSSAEISFVRRNSSSCGCARRSTLAHVVVRRFHREPIRVGVKIENHFAQILLHELPRFRCARQDSAPRVVPELIPHESHPLSSPSIRDILAASDSLHRSQTA